MVTTRSPSPTPNPLPSRTIPRHAGAATRTDEATAAARSASESP